MCCCCTSWMLFEFPHFKLMSSGMGGSIAHHHTQLKLLKPLQSELPFRMLCRRYGATAAYTPMLHARLFSESEKYRTEHFSTCPEDRPLFVQFCANDPDILVQAATHVDDGSCDYVDLNFGCPQRIAKRGHYGAFLMDDLPCAESLIRALHKVRSYLLVVYVFASALRLKHRSEGPVPTPCDPINQQNAESGYVTENFCVCPLRPLHNGGSTTVESVLALREQKLPQKLPQHHRDIRTA